MSAPVRTTCPYCGVGCGVLAAPRRGGVEISGDPRHPANLGKLCVKGAALGETVALDGRLLHPVVRETRGGKRETARQAGWDEALDAVAGGFRKIIDEHGPDAVAFYVSGQLLTEDYYVANKLIKGYIGTANIDTNSRLCMASAVAGHKRTFGEDLVPASYEDLELADLVVLAGSNTAWCHPILYQRIARARELRPEMKVVVIDPRRTATCDIADLHLPLKSGSDVALFNGLLDYLDRHGVEDAAFVDAHTQGLRETLRVAQAGGDLHAVARACGLDAHLIDEFFRLFARTARTVTVFSQGVNQSSSGTDKVNSIINCHLLTGRIGKPGAGPFSVTGQPNAMGGREVGGMCNMLAAHMEIGDARHREIVQAFWNSPCMVAQQGLKAVELFDAIDAGKVKALWIMATNPVVSMPDADKVKAALAKCELVVVSDVMQNTDTTACAHVLLPALAWGEKDGTVTNSDRRISRQRAFLPPPGQARPDWWMVCEVAKRMGFGEGFNFSSPHEIFDEHARLSAYRNAEAENGRRESEKPVALRCFDIGGLAGMTREQYDALLPVQWPLASPVSHLPSPGTARLFADGKFFHADGKARFIPTAPRAPANPADAEFPLVLNTGRIRDQWHTMTRTGLSPKLADHVPEPYVDMHPHDALSCGVRAGELVRVATRWGALVARLTTSGEQPRGSVFVPIHWSGQFASDARVGALVNPAVDPVSGEPEFKHTPVRVGAFGVDWHGFILSRRALDVDGVTWWTRIQGRQFLRYELGGRGPVQDWPAWGRALLGAQDPAADWLEYSDATAGIYRGVLMQGERIEACVFVSPRPDLPSRAWLSSLFGKQQLAQIDRVGLLIGEPVDKQADTGPTVCSCYGVGRNTLADAIRKHRLRTAGEVTACLKAGGNCGSCVPEIKSLLIAALAGSDEMERR
ncbi:MAG TPA: molybdopterin-dependent oxidoreductase [Stenotrophobium sp.]|jgi:assimilatory nitrate reductase catalytic subunit|nr:molybdopterin-dependent oxidoreductase [Stenotrophobium sp.]